MRDPGPVYAARLSPAEALREMLLRGVMMRKGSTVAFATTVALSAVLGYFYFARSAEEDVSASERVDQRALADARGQESVSGGPVATPTKSNVGSNPVRQWTADIPIGMSDPLQEPKSQEELQWLRRNGYPSSDALKDAMFGRASINDLVLEDGISGWELVRAEQVAAQEPHNREQAVAFLEEAASQGSIYALQSLGRVYGDPSTGNILQSEAYYKVAEMRGDWTAHMRVRHVQPTADQDLISSLMAYQFLERMDNERRAKGLQPLISDPRPGLNAFLMAMYEANKKK